MKKLIINLLFFLSISYIRSVSGQIRSDFLLIDQGWTPDNTIDKNGNLHVTWVGFQEAKIYYCLFDSLVYQVKPPEIIDSAGWFLYDPKIATKEDHSIIIWKKSFPSSGNITGQLLTIEGDTINDNFQLSYTNYEPGFSNVTFLNDTTILVVWLDSRGGLIRSGVYGQIVTTSGQTIGSNILLNDDTSTNIERYHTSIAYHPQTENILIVWVDKIFPYTKYHIYGRFFTKSLIPLSSTFLIHEGPDSLIVSQPLAMMHESGEFTIVWNSGRYNNGFLYDAYIQRFDCNGSPYGLNERVNENTSTYTIELDISMDNDGKFIVVWSQKNSNYSKIYAQRYLSDSTPLGSNFLISSDTDTFHHWFPSVALSGGKVYTIWEQKLSSVTKIWANIIDFYNPPTQVYNNENINTPEICSLFQNYPNPFNSSTIIKYEIFKKLCIELTVYNLLGNKIVTLEKKVVMPGIYQSVWYGKDSEGGDVPSGIYFYRLKSGKIVFINKMLIVR